MGSTIFLIDGENRLTELRRADYDSEDLFQKLLASHPRLLSTSDDGDSRLLLIRREFGVPEDAGSSDRWSLDHLFVDRNAVPVLVEVKRSSDTRARREVVAQMLDYAANGVAYWPIDKMVDAFRETCAAQGDIAADDMLLEFLNGGDQQAFWQQVEANLRAGRVRMVFVADRIGKELRRIVEFLNEQMRPAEVLAIEVEQFVGASGVRTLVPRVLGDTERAQSTKAVGGARKVTSTEEWFADLGASKGAESAAQARKVLAWFEANGFQTGVTTSGDAIFAHLVRGDGKPSWPFFLRKSTGKLETALQYLQNDPAFASEEARLSLLAAIKALPGVAITTTKATGWPAVPFTALADPALWEPLSQILLRVRDRILQDASRP
jgi:hypothetical protein